MKFLGLKSLKKSFRPKKSNKNFLGLKKRFFGAKKWFVRRENLGRAKKYGGV